MVFSGRQDSCRYIFRQTLRQTRAVTVRVEKRLDNHQCPAQPKIMESGRSLNSAPIRPSNHSRQLRRPFLRTLWWVPGILLAATTGPLPAAETTGITAVRAADFLDSIGTQSAISVRGENFQKTIACAQYLGARWFRGGVEGNVPIEQFIKLHQQTGLRFSWGLGSGGTNIPKLIETGRLMAAAGALLAFEGPNEPNNWGFSYQGQAGGRDKSWLPVAKLQSDLYSSVKSDPLLKNYPVWSITEGGAEKDNVGLQFLTIPNGAGTLMPDGTQYADFANVHNYFYHPNAPGLEDNKTWNAADPSAACKVDGLFGEYGVTWAHHYRGYSETELATLPRVTTETGTTIGGPVTEEIHALNLLSLFLDQFKRGWSYTCVYLLRDRVDEAGNQQFGYYRPDYSPRPAAVYLHNLTTILADNGALSKPDKLDYSILDKPATVHDLLLQKSDSSFALAVWSELVNGTNNVQVNLGGTYATIKIYDPTTGTMPIQTNRAINSLTLGLSNHPLVIAIPANSREQ